MCSICCDGFTGKGRATLECGHEFHLQCISTWLSQKGGRSCPVCRTPPTEKEKLHDVDPEAPFHRMVDGVTPLMFAATNNDAAETLRLIHSGENVNACDSDGDTPLLYAVSNRHEEVAKLLLTAGADVTVIAKLVAAPATPDGALAAACAFHSPACLTRLMTMRVTLAGVERAREIAVSKSYMDLAYLLMVKRDVIKARWWPFKTSVF